MVALPFLTVILVLLSVGYSQRQYFSTRPLLHDYLADVLAGKNYAAPFRLSNYQFTGRQNLNRLLLPYALHEESSKLPDLTTSIQYKNDSDEPESFLRSAYIKNKNDEKISGRFGLANLENVALNFLKTVVHYETSIITETATVMCIPAALFKDPASQSKACRRKRDAAFLDRVAEAVSNPDINPSAVFAVEQSVKPNSVGKVDIRPLMIKPDEVQSSKEKPSPKEFVVGDGAREKRFLYLLLNNLVTLSTTITSFSFTTATSTATIELAAAKAVTCLPPGFTICT